MKVRLPPMKNHMHFRKQSDGHSWLVFTRPATGGRRSIAIIHIPDPHRDPTIEWLPGIEHAEHPQVEKLAGEIRRKRLTFETKQSSAPASVSAALPSDAPASEPEAVRELILCEGETEQRFFEALCGFLGLKDRIDVKVSPAKEPCLVLRNLAKDMLLARQINEVEYGPRILLVLRVEGLKSAETVVGRYDLLNDFFRHHPLEGGRQGFLALNVLDHDLLVKEQRAVKLLEMQE